MNNTAGRLGYLEGLRGAAASIVLLYHYFASMSPCATYGPTYPERLPFEGLLWSTPLGLPLRAEFAVSLFFVLSAYVLSASFLGANPRSAACLVGNMVKRPFRLGGMVVLTSLICFELQSQGRFYTNKIGKISPLISMLWREAKTPSTSDLAEILLLSPFSRSSELNPVLWTIAVELYGAWLVFGLLLVFRGRSWRYLAYLGAFVYLNATHYQSFVLGLLIADLVQSYPDLLRHLRQRRVIWLLGPVALYFASVPAYVPAAERVGTMYSWLPGIDVFLGDGYATVGATLVLLSALISPAMQRWFSRRPWTFLGRISYGMYAIHFALIGSFSLWAFIQLKPWLGHVPAMAAVAPPTILVSLGSALILTRWVDQPSVRLANRIGRYTQERVVPALASRWQRLRGAA